MACKIMLPLLLLITVLVATTTAARDIPINPGHDLAARLEASGGLVECWNSLLELKSCSNEIVLFFLSGQADIGPLCCHAIYIITHSCWPAMLTSLGFTVEEGNILRGYCDASAGGGGPAAAAPAPAGAPVQYQPQGNPMALV